MSVFLKASVSYFVVVFGAGFILGPIRILYVVPRFGERKAELMEATLMLIVLAARWVVRRFEVAPARGVRIAIGVFALLLGLLFEFGFVLWLRGLSVTEYFRGRDPISATVYYITLVVFALMPLLVGDRRSLTTS
jgi:type IV secretory pathway TrbD component